MNSREDYRSSHLAKGEAYDSFLARSSFDAYMAARERDLITKIVGAYFPNRIPRYLDFACGTGRVTSVVAPSAVASFGIDVSGTMIDEARRKLPGTTFLVTDITRQRALRRVADHLVRSCERLSNGKRRGRKVGRFLWAKSSTQNQRATPLAHLHILEAR